jgi:hypothetical protein
MLKACFPIAIVFVACCCVSLRSFAQTAVYRDFDTEHYDRAVAGKDDVERPQAIDLIVQKTNDFRKKHDRDAVKANEEVHGFL